MTRSSLPVADALIALEPEVFQTLQRAVALLFRVAHSPAFEARVDVEASPVARHRAGNFGVFMGYDFHLTPDGPRLIEINTNAGGALVNGLHTAKRIDPVALACLCSDLGLSSVEVIEKRIVESFHAELAAARPGGVLRSVVIADHEPHKQFLHPEFELMRELFERHGIAASITDTGELRRAPGGLFVGERHVDLVYLRDTDFQLETERTRALRDAWLAGEVVLTPSPREHHLLADKRRLVLFSSRDALRELGVCEAEAGLLAQVVPETRPLAELGRDAAWQTRREWVFKPARAFGSRAVYRGDKISRPKLDEIFAQGDFVAQRAVAPGEIEVSTGEGPRRMKFDVRVYAYRDEILLLGARSYAGQVTNMRTPGGGFSAVCVVKRAG